MREHFPDCYRLHVQGVEIDCYLGVYEHEQRKVRPVTIEVELFVPITEPAARGDELSGTLNYEKVIESIERIVASRRFKLIEALCSELVDDMATLPGLRAVKVSVTKPQPMARARAVSVEQWRVL